MVLKKIPQLIFNLASMYRAITLLLIICTASVLGFTQDRNKNILKLNLSTDNIPVYTIDQNTVAASLAADSINYHLKKSHVATSMALPINSEYDGIWNNRSGDIIWSAGIMAPGAKQLSLVLKNIEMHAGSKLYIYTQDKETILGPFNRNNVENGFLVIPFLPSDFIYLEYQVPNHQVLGKIEVESIGYQKTDMLNDRRFGRAGECNVDINCITSNQIQQLKNSVARIFINGTDYCSATLINNTKQKGTPYLITASHCVNSILLANRTNFYFKYESPYCNGPDNDFVMIEGAELIATSNRIDFSLLKLNSNLDFQYQPYYTGWDATGEKPNSTFTIHHPQGDVKKISKDGDPPEYSSFGWIYDDDSHWKINRWETGTTEDGSSGGALFNENYLLVGSLTGGVADCEVPEDDYFQMFRDSFNKYSDESEQLQYWLDPDTSGLLILEGYDPYLLVKQNGDTLSNISNPENLVCEKLTMWGYLTGQSSYGATEFVELIQLAEEKTLLGFVVQVAKAEAMNDNTNVTFMVYNNNSGPGTELISKSYALDYFISGKTSYIEFDEPINVTDDFFLGYRIEYLQPSDTFALYYQGNKEDNTTWVKNKNDQWVTFNNYHSASTGASLAIYPIVYDSIATDTTFTPENIDQVLIYPVPVTNGNLHLVFEDVNQKTVTIKMYSVDGKLVVNQHFYGQIQTIDLPIDNLINGVYFIILALDDKILKQRIIVHK